MGLLSFITGSGKSDDSQTAQTDNQVQQSVPNPITPFDPTQLTTVQNLNDTNLQSAFQPLTDNSMNSMSPVDQMPVQENIAQNPAMNSGEMYNVQPEQTMSNNDNPLPPLELTSPQSPTPVQDLPQDSFFSFNQPQTESVTNLPEASEPDMNLSQNAQETSTQMQQDMGSNPGGLNSEYNKDWYKTDGSPADQSLLDTNATPEPQVIPDANILPSEAPIQEPPVLDLMQTTPEPEVTPASNITIEPPVAAPEPLASTNESPVVPAEEFKMPELKIDPEVVKQLSEQYLNNQPAAAPTDATASQTPVEIPEPAQVEIQPVPNATSDVVASQTAEIPVVETSKIEEPVTNKVEAEPTPSTNTKMKVINSIALLGLNGPLVNKNDQQLVNDLVTKLADSKVNIMFDSKNGLGVGLLELLNQKKAKATGVFFKPILSNLSKTTEDDMNNVNVTSVLYSNFVSRAEHIIKDSKAFIILNSGGVSNLALLSLVWSLALLYQGNNKPVILLGDWTNVMNSLGTLLSPSELSLVTNAKTADEAISTLMQVESQYQNSNQSKAKLIDKRMEGDEQEFRIT